MMPMLLSDMTVKIRITNTAGIFICIKLTLKNIAPKNKYISAFIEVKIKSHNDNEIITVDKRVGVTNIASNVPVTCSFLIFPEKACIAVEKYPAKAIPIKT